MILIVAAPINALRVLSDAAFTSAAPGLVGRAKLGRANGYLEATLSVPFIVGPAIAGVLVATVGAATTLAIDAASFAVSAVSLTFVRRTLRAERPAEMPRIAADIKELVSYMTLRASITPDELLGRVGSTARTVTVSLQPLGLLAAGVLRDAGDGGLTLVTMGVVAIAATVLFGLSRTVREAGH